MDELALAARFLAIAYLVLLSIVVALRAFASRAVWADLVADRPGGPPVPDRILILMGTIMAAFYWLLLVMKGMPVNQTELPPISAEIVAVLIGGNVFLVGRKLLRPGK